MHHAYLIEGSPALAREASLRFAKELGLSLVGSPDLHLRMFDSFGIEDARALQEIAQMRGVSGCKFFALGCSSMTTEAQNALLKLFEEPPQDTHFVLALPHGVALPTLRSRMEMLTLQEKSGREEEARAFLRGTYRERSGLIAAIIRDKDRGQARTFLDALERTLYAEAHTPFTREEGEGLADIARARSYLADRSPSIKMLLEHLAVTLPQTPLAIDKIV